MQPSNKQPGAASAGGPDPSPAERKARQFLAEGRFRKARDEIKPLVKGDRARFLPLLIEANCGLAREMLGKGLTSDAEQVLVYLRTIAPASQLLLLESEMAFRSGGADHMLPAMVHLLGDPAASISEADRQRMADRLVVASDRIAPQGNAVRLSAELGAVLSALRFLCAQEYDQAMETLRPIPHGSVFSHWKVFLKGLVAFYRGEAAKATRCFHDLPVGSVPAKAAKPYVLLAAEDLRAAVANGVPDPLVEDVCRLLNLPRLGPVLARAEREWRGRKPYDSYLTVRAGIDRFPSQTLDWVGVLSEFYYNAAHSLPWELAEDFVIDLEESLSYYNPKSEAEPLLVHRASALFNKSDVDSAEARWHWEEFLRLHESLHGHNPRLASKAYAWLGMRLAVACESVFSSFGRSSYPSGNEKEAILAFEKSIALDPTNLHAQLGLCRVFVKLGMDSRRNRLLDSMTKRFPDDKAVLIQAGRGCLDRKACSKGLGYLEQAFELDRLDPAIPDLLVAARVMLARDYFKGDKQARARLALDAAMQLAVDDPVNLQRSRWTLLVRRGVLEELHEGRGKGDSLLAAGRECSPGAEAFLFFAHAAFCCYRKANFPPSPFAKELLALTEAQPSLTKAPFLIRILQFWRQVKDAPDMKEPEEFVRGYLRRCARQPFSPEDVRIVFDLTGPESPFAAEVLNLVQQVLRKDSADPRFRLCRFLLDQEKATDLPLLEAELTSIEHEAARRGDHQTVQSTRQARTAIHSRPLGPPALDDSWLADEDDDFELAEDEPEFQDGPIETEEELIAFVRALASLSGPELAQARKRMANVLPPGVLDMLLSGARQGKLPPPPPKRPSLGPTPPPHTPLPPDPNQLELF